MCTCTNPHIVVDYSRGMNISLIFYNNTANTRDVCVYAIPISNFSIVPYHRIGLNHIVVAYGRIITYHGVCTDEITLSYLCIRIDSGCFMNQLIEHASPADYFFHTRFPCCSSYRRNKNIVNFWNIIMNRSNNRRIFIKSIKGIQVIIDKAFDFEIFPEAHTSKGTIIHSAAHTASSNDY